MITKIIFLILLISLEFCNCQLWDNIARTRATMILNPLNTNCRVINNAGDYTGGVLLPNTGGVYAYFDVNGIARYIGKSTNLRSRFTQHRNTDNYGIVPSPVNAPYQNYKAGLRFYCHSNQIDDENIRWSYESLLLSMFQTEINEMYHSIGGHAEVPTGNRVFYTPSATLATIDWLTFINNLIANNNINYQNLKNRLLANTC
ncbi:hypothetical protein DLAC_02267 [Tieghemostelium lacteum]|uniref:GIY-YIG domain-containing protein n=1 Tax=Tieghemostelium lacteum TaxID=361077 RepID=A0A152A4J5_TIELA|nr:hypothetical protein DLAC_02267 [Tieghemostelium lacteum]|eukprot:KYR01158.1 hypothetical protein DLAC_02267 [Tieghemostelium lacteum]